MPASSRYYLGVLPRTAVATSDATPVKLKALALGPGALNSGKSLALALQCHDCVPRVNGRVEIEGTLWLTFRGDSDTCTPQHVPNSTEHQCHTDHIDLYNKVFVHFATLSLAVVFQTLAPHTEYAAAAACLLLPRLPAAAACL